MLIRHAALALQGHYYQPFEQSYFHHFWKKHDIEVIKFLHNSCLLLYSRFCLWHKGTTNIYIYVPRLQNSIAVKLTYQSTQQRRTFNLASLCKFQARNSVSVCHCQLFSHKLTTRTTQLQYSNIPLAVTYLYI